MFAAATLATGVPVLSAAQSSALCDGQQATIVGTDGDDLIVGTQEADVIVGLGGNDIIVGLSGNDVICGGLGDDEISAGRGADVVLGNSGDDTIRGQRGQDAIFGGPGDDTLLGNNGADLITGQRGADTIEGGAGADDLSGGRGQDIIEGGTGDDFLRGGNGIDFLEGDDGDDIINSGRGNDILNGGAGDDDIRTGDSLGDILILSPGMDILDGEPFPGFTGETEPAEPAIEFEPLTSRLALTPAASFFLQNAADFLIANPQTTAVIEGHARTADSPEANLVLSQGRAEAVVDFLVELGVDESQLQAQGFGDTAPVTVNGAEDRRLGDRIEFVVI